MWIQNHFKLTSTINRRMSWNNCRCASVHGPFAWEIESELYTVGTFIGNCIIRMIEGKYITDESDLDTEFSRVLPINPTDMPFVFSFESSQLSARHSIVR